VSEREAQLTELVGRYASLIRGTVAKVAGRRDDDLADEVVQRIAEALWKRLDELTAIERPVSYLYRCAVRETVRELARRLPEATASLEHDTQVSTTTEDPEQSTRAGELAAATEACLATMSPERAAAARAHIAGFDVDEIMAMHDWPYQKARNLIARGLADLRAGLNERGYP